MTLEKTSQTVYTPVSSHVSFPDIEHDVLDFWRKEDIFGKTLAARQSAPAFSFYDGPPFATGLPHYGHLVGGTLKDIVPRYWTMRGFNVPRRFGWDCHGLPIESLVQKELGLASVKEIREYGIANFNEVCRNSVLKYVAEWKSTVERMGRWVDFENDYKTMDVNFMESVWWVFKEAFDKGLIYQDYRVQPYSPALATPLSNFEVNQGYKDRQDPAVTVTFPLVGKDASFLVWTTTPWTLPSNLAVAVNPELDYVMVTIESGSYWLAASRKDVLFKDTPIVQTKKGSEFVGFAYTPLFTFAPLQSPKQYTLIAASFVTDSDGTGAVHIAPSFGEDDFIVGKENGLGMFDPLDNEGKFTDCVMPFCGVEAKEADKAIIKTLKDNGRVFLHETIVHSYPHCWRTGVPLLYRALKTWFLKVDAPLTNNEGEVKTLKQWMLASNAITTWVPEHIKDGRFGKWLAGARDWNLGRNRFWGTPIPVWVAEDGDTLCVGSCEQLAKLTGKTVSDLHLHVISELTVTTKDKHTFDPNGKEYKLTGEVLDCWFESGSMPYAQKHYPFENKESFAASFPADFIAEGLDQTRGWFYTLSVLSAALFQKPAFKNVIVNGIVLAENGQKMSKSLRNYTPPNEMMERLGADSMRLFLINSPAVYAEDLRFSDAGAMEMARAVLLPYWNAYSFFVTYANVDGFVSQTDQCPESQNELDVWIVSIFNHLVASVNLEMESYRLYKVVPLLIDFIDNLTNWYVRRSRRRFWKSENDSDKMSAYQTLYYVLLQFSKVMAPFLPFCTESMYRNLAGACKTKLPQSVHLCDYPIASPNRINADLEMRMNLVRQAVSMGRTLRSRYTIKTRQPLATLTIVVLDAKKREMLIAMDSLIAEELNVKKVHFEADEKAVVTVCAKANFKKLGKVFGSDMKSAAAIIETLDAKSISALMAGETLTILDKPLSLDDVEIRRQKKEGVEVETSGELTVALDTIISPELLAEGYAREFVNRIQNIRKTRDLNVSDRLHVVCSTAPVLQNALMQCADYIKAETLTTTLVFEEIQEGESIEVSDISATVSVRVL